MRSRFVFPLPTRLLPALLVALALCAPAHALPGLPLTCVSDPQKFAFMKDGKGTTFSFGTREQVERAYAKLKETMGRPATYPRATVFYSKGFAHLTMHYCEARDTCTTKDILNGLQNCNAGGMGPADTCYPMAAVHAGRVYCMLLPKEGGEGFRPLR
ncbi:hypothetical protein ACLBXM_22350 [Xanthobacteraceae bacterium A53D]